VRFLARPARRDAPTLLLLHGRGGREDDLVPLVDAIDPDMGYLAPRGPEPEGGGYAWFRNIRIGIPVVESLEARLSELAGWLDSELAGDDAPGSVVAVGFSNGGMMAGAVAAARPSLVRGAACLSAAYPLPDSMRQLGGLAGKPVYLGAGDADPFHPVEVFREGVAWYRAAGALVTERLVPGAGHQLTVEEVADLRAWIPSLG
jgi:phospholipase/carboxylesterase